MDAFNEQVRISRAPFPVTKFSIQLLVAEGDMFAMTWLWKGSHKDAIPDFEATDRAIEMSGVTLCFFEQYQISGHWQVADQLSVYQQLAKNQNQAVQ